MEEEGQESAAQIPLEILRQMSLTESQAIVSTIGSQASPTLEQAAQEASIAAERPRSFKIYEEVNEPQDFPAHSTSNMSEPNLDYVPDGHSIIPTSFQTPTAPLAAIPSETAIGDHAKYGVLPVPDREAERQNLDSSSLSYVDGSMEGSQQNDISSLVDTEQHQIQAFAKLEFDDGEFYMNTYAVEIGRDVHAARQAAELQARQDTQTKAGKRSASAGGSNTPGRLNQRSSQNMTRNIASDRGGVIAVDHYESEPTRKPSSRKPKSRSSSSQQLSRKSSMLLSNRKTDYNALAMASLMAYDSDLKDLTPHNYSMPSPDLVPLVPVHPPALPEGAPSSGKSISRKHIRIAYNFHNNLFEVEILGRNGGFVDEEWYAKGDVQTLMNGSIIQIGGVGIKFVLPDVGPDEIGAETAPGSDSLSSETVGFRGAESVEDDSDEDIEGDGERTRTFDITGEGEDEEGEGEEEGEDKDAEGSEALRIRAKGKKRTDPEPLPVKKRKGPGRPPKNGVISKREQALLARQAREKAKAGEDADSGTPHDHSRLKAGKHTGAVKKEQPSLQPNGKRKYTKRKRAGGIDDQRVRDSTEQTDSVPPEQSIAAKLPPKPAKERKPPKPPRSPSPVYDESKLTEEQLRRPQHNYIVLIHEALSNSPTGAMSLPQIYRAMQRRYPYFKLRATTVGWQSSVRHNLSQHAAFQKIERDGKGWMWGLVPGVSIEKEKKRKPTPPPESRQPYYAPNVQAMQYHQQYPPRVQQGYFAPPRMAPILKFEESDSTYQSPYQSTLPSHQHSAFAPPPPPQPGPGTNGHYPTSTQSSDYRYSPYGRPPNPSPAPYPPRNEILANSLSGPTNDALPPHSQSNPASLTNDGSSLSLPAATPTGAEIAMEHALTNGDARRRDSAVDEDKGSGKRPHENGAAGEGATDQSQPDAKRAAIEA